MITGRPDFLEPWEAGRAGFDRQMEIVRNRVVDLEQLRRVDDIRAAGRRYLTGYSAPLVDVARDDRRRAARVIARGEGKRRVDALRSAFDRLAQTEEALASSAAARAADREQGATSAVLIAGALLVLLFLALVAYLEAQAAELEDNQSDLSAVNDELRAQGEELTRVAEQLASEKEAVETS